MFALPGPTQVTTPEELTEATAVLLLLHTPPGVPVVVKVTNVPGQPKLVTPFIVPAVAFEFTVIDLLMITMPQPVTVYVMFAVPWFTPVTTPALLTIAIFVLSLLHVPPAVAVVVNAVTDPAHTDELPLMTPETTCAFTVICLEADDTPQPFTVYVMEAVPGLTPVTKPVVASTVATLRLSLLHVPPAVPFVLNGVEEPAHTDPDPPIVPATAAVVTVIDFCVDTGPPQPFTV